MAFLASQPYHKNYSGKKLSFGFLFCFLIWSLIFIAPFFLSFTTRNFWPTNELYYEQPAVLMKPELLILMKTDAQTLTYSNIDVISRKIGTNGLSPIIKFTNIDENNDELTDLISFELLLNTNSSALRSLDLFLFFDYGFRSKVRLQMEGMIRVSFSSSNGISKAYGEGDLKFRQKNVLDSSFFTQNRYNKSEFTDTDVFSLKQTIQKYMQRNETLEYSYTGYQSAGYPTQNQTQVFLEFKIPVFQQIQFVPTLIDSWKSAWTQYVSLFVPLFVFWKAFMCFVYQKRILGALQDNDLRKRT